MSVYDVHACEEEGEREGLEENCRRLLTVRAGRIADSCPAASYTPGIPGNTPCSCFPHLSVAW